MGGGPIAKKKMGGYHPSDTDDGDRLRVIVTGIRL
jgi:hypothetical protein